MLIYLYGEDRYRRRERARMIVREFEKKYGNLGVEHEDAEDVALFESLRERVGTPSLFSPLRLICVENMDPAILKASKELRVWLKSMVGEESVVLLLQSDAAPTRESFFLTEEPVTSERFDLLAGREIESFVLREAERRGLRLGRGELGEYVETYGGDTWGIVMELEKRSLMRGALPSSGEAESRGERVPQKTFFQLVMALSGARRVEDRLIALEELVGVRGEEPAKIFNIMAARRMGERSGDAARAVADLDVAVKSGELEYEEALLLQAISA